MNQVLHSVLLFQEVVRQVVDQVPVDLLLLVPEELLRGELVVPEAVPEPPSLFVARPLRPVPDHVLVGVPLPNPQLVEVQVNVRAVPLWVIFLLADTALLVPERAFRLQKHYLVLHLRENLEVARVVLYQVQEGSPLKSLNHAEVIAPHCTVVGRPGEKLLLRKKLTLPVLSNFKVLLFFQVVLVDHRDWWDKIKF